MKFRKKPVVIDAIQLEDSVGCLMDLSRLGLDPVDCSYEDKGNLVLKIETLEGTMTANVGDYIIKGVNEEFYPCKPDIFEKTYEKETSAEPSEIGCVDRAHTPCACGGDTFF